jgi:hypothetical protein
VFNSIISTFEDDKMDSVWNGAFETLYRRKAAELTASLTTDEGYGNGNKTLLTRVLKGEIDIEDLTSMKPYELRQVLQTSHQGQSFRRSSNFRWRHFDYVYLSKCGSKKMYVHRTTDEISRRRVHYVRNVCRLFL